jgi:23S rRNA (guanosine2251-2'-O)-methyltransferase
MVYFLVILDWKNFVFITLGAYMITEKLQNDVIVGRNAISEALKSDIDIDKVYCTKGISGSALPIIKKCKDRGIVIKEVSSEKLKFIAGTDSHQGIAATVAAFSYSSVDDILKNAEDKGEKPFIVICDEIEDPHNLGAIIRTSEVMGASGVIIPKRRSASLTQTVSKTSAGALMHIPVARVQNLASVIDSLKEKGIWIYGAEMSENSVYDTDFSGGVALVLGSEGKGIGRLIKEKCDFLVSIPMYGKVNSLNASVAAGIIISEIAKGRHK